MLDLLGKINETNARIDTSTAVAAKAADQDQLTGFRNKLINGAMTIWQRGTTFASITSLKASADRWVFESSSGNVTISQYTADGPAGFANSLQIAHANAVNGRISQKIESVNCTELSGADVTISFWAKSTALGGTSHVISLSYPTTTADDWSAATNLGSKPYSPTITWTKFTFTYKKLNAGVLRGLKLQIQETGPYTSGSTWITGVQLEVGDTATAFEYRPYGLELLLAQRYYEQSYPAGTAPGTVTTNGCIYFLQPHVNGSFGCRVMVYCQVQKRLSSTIHVYSVNSGAIDNIYNITQAIDMVATITFGGSGKAFRPSANAAFASGDQIEFHWTWDAEIY